MQQLKVGSAWVSLKLATKVRIAVTRTREQQQITPVASTIPVWFGPVGIELLEKIDTLQP
jgi:hypothetical protein